MCVLLYFLDLKIYAEFKHFLGIKLSLEEVSGCEKRFDHGILQDAREKLRNESKHWILRL